ncbi:MAG: iron-containing alcohol dehydrogenase [Proteobacteria bacterium]|nr:iron-containing alcohol dehydrogenase [Pseudomonadota bacterium]MBU2227356.1 iron-containing alcohol dehydrogenase [Pseudomonadota bacterium]MBU2262188.1 iron-containing alcohol dehydrogenase [Pseudomonadota bacterium]
MAYDQDLSFVYFGPTRVIFGVGASRDCEMEMAGLGCRRALVMTDPGVMKAGLVEGVLKALGDKCVGVFSDVPQDTGVGVVNRAADYARGKGADCVVSVGGGSVIDTGKGVCILLTEGGGLENFEGIQLLTRPQTPHIVIPTTAGTGSEVTCMAVILDERKGQKILIVEYFNTPRIAILDPVMTEKLPPLLTASTGMDAMTHAVEALQSVQREPIADGLAMQAIRLLYRFLPICTQNGADLAARGQVQLAATMAGWAFGNAMVGLVHAMAHSLGAIARVPHGIANGILLPHVMAFNLEDAAESYALVAEAMGVREKGMDEREAAEAAVAALRSFLGRIGHPVRLSEVSVTEEALVKASALSLSDGAIVNNARPVMDEGEVLAVYRTAY